MLLLSNRRKIKLLEKNFGKGCCFVQRRHKRGFVIANLLFSLCTDLVCTFYILRKSTRSILTAMATAPAFGDLGRTAKGENCLIEAFITKQTFVFLRPPMLHCVDM